MRPTDNEITRQIIETADRSLNRWRKHYAETTPEYYIPKIAGIVTLWSDGNAYAIQMDVLKGFPADRVSTKIMLSQIVSVALEAAIIAKTGKGVSGIDKSGKKRNKHFGVAGW